MCPLCAAQQFDADIVCVRRCLKEANDQLEAAFLRFLLQFEAEEYKVRLQSAGTMPPSNLLV